MAIRVLHVIGSLRLGGAQVVVKHIVENASAELYNHNPFPETADVFHSLYQCTSFYNGLFHQTNSK